MSAVDEVAGTETRVTARAESVGSLLRPEALKEVFDQAYGRSLHVDVFSSERQHAVAELQRLAGEVIPELVERQLDAGLDVITDGEMTRGFFANSMIDAISGIDLEGESRSEDWSGDPVPIVTERLAKRGNPALREAQALSEVTPAPKKITFPAASYFFYKRVIEVSPEAYPDRDGFIDDVVRIQRELVEEVIAAGIEHIQFDFPIYPMLADESAAERAAALGETPDSLLEKALAADARMVANLPEHVTTGIHLCRGNQIRFFSGTLEPIAERIFALPYDRFLIEFHDLAADGGYDPIRFVPPGKVMVMGLINTKSPEVENEDELMGRMETASRLLDLSQLAISPQCGFASTWRGHDYSVDVQWRKLELAGKVADRLWGNER